MRRQVRQLKKYNCKTFDALVLHIFSAFSLILLKTNIRCDYIRKVVKDEKSSHLYV